MLMNVGANSAPLQDPENNRLHQDRSSRKVLIIEDNADFARLMGRYMSMFGHEIEIAADGQTGLEKARELVPEVVICDIHLPDMDGWSIARTLNDPNGLQRPALIIALTGFSGERDIAQSKEAGFDLHMVKPPDFQRLRRIVSDLSP
jgi:CheY-like chemotaxis protein